MKEYYLLQNNRIKKTKKVASHLHSTGKYSRYFFKGSDEIFKHLPTIDVFVPFNNLSTEVVADSRDKIYKYYLEEK